MILKEVRDIVEGMELSPEAMKKIEELLAAYSANDDVPDEVVDAILRIVDVEMDATKLAADIYQSGAELVDDFLKKVDDEAGKIADEIEDMKKDEK